MDKKNTLIGVILLVAAFATMYFSAKLSPPAQPAPEITQTAGPNMAGQAIRSTSPSDASFVAPKGPATAPSSVVLSNDAIRVTFTNYGGAIKDIALVSTTNGKGGKPGGLQYPISLSQPTVPYELNANSVDPALALDELPGLDRGAPYQLVSQSATQVVYRAIYENRIEVYRSYTLVPGNGDSTHDPYQIRYETTFRNLTKQTLMPMRAVLNLGTATPLDASDTGLYQTNGYHFGTKTKFIPRSELDGGGLLSWVGIGSKEPRALVETDASVSWASVQNQFFVSLLTPDRPGTGLYTRRIELPAFPDSSTAAIGLKSEARFELPAITPNGTATLSGSFYAGPKEYKRLANPEVFKLDQDDVMEFGLFSFFSKLLLTVLNWVHKGFSNWGVAIILTTLILKIVFMPFTLTASKSARRMQKIQPEMTVLREKYKDNPQKLQSATMELFKKHKVNPMGGCFPILITIPFFIGFFAMLRSNADFRFEGFLWAHDLSAPDTVARVFGLPINIMPILMGLMTGIQMRLTPQPTVDNAQVKMMKFMPYVFALLFYNYSCALALYSAVNSGFSIVQQLIINRMRDKEDTATPSKPEKGVRAIKNVTPAKAR